MLRQLSIPFAQLTDRGSLLAKVPFVLKPLLALVPQKVQQTLLMPTLHAVFAEAIADGDFAFLENKWLEISITDLGLCWLLSFKDNQLVMASNNQQVIKDVCFSAAGDDLLLIAGRKEDPDTLFFQRRLKIEGDTELGLEVKNLIDAIDLDKLPRIIHKGVDLLATFIANNKITD